LGAEYPAVFPETAIPVPVLTLTTGGDTPPVAGVEKQIVDFGVTDSFCHGNAVTVFILRRRFLFPYDDSRGTFILIAECAMRMAAVSAVIGIGVDEQTSATTAGDDRPGMPGWRKPGLA
jgi:hypothetical protein